jgi:hypothetical protein
LSLNLLFRLLSNFNLKEQSIVRDACKSYKDSNYKTLLEEINACLKIYYESLKERFKESNRNKPKSSLQNIQADTIWKLTNILYDFIHKMIEQLINDQKINDLKIKKKLFACNVDITNKLKEKFRNSQITHTFFEMHSNDIIKFIESQIDMKIKDLTKEFIAMI